VEHTASAVARFHPHRYTQSPQFRQQNPLSLRHFTKCNGKKRNVGLRQSILTGYRRHHLDAMEATADAWMLWGSARRRRSSRFSPPPRFRGAATPHPNIRRTAPQAVFLPTWHASSNTHASSSLILELGHALVGRMYDWAIPRILMIANWDRPSPSLTVRMNMTRNGHGPKSNKQTFSLAKDTLKGEREIYS
jgi:hypothetical protein